MNVATVQLRLAGGEARDAVASRASGVVLSVDLLQRKSSQGSVAGLDNLFEHKEAFICMYF